MTPLRSALVALVLIAMPLRGLASDLDKQSYWLGFLLGSGITVCELYKNGFLARNDADTFLKELFKPDADVPRVTIQLAKAQLTGDRDYRNCPVPK